jgi:hypothetical protein
MPKLAGSILSIYKVDWQSPFHALIIGHIWAAPGQHVGNLWGSLHTEHEPS